VFEPPTDDEDDAVTDPPEPDEGDFPTPDVPDDDST